MPREDFKPVPAGLVEFRRRYWNRLNEAVTRATNVDGPTNSMQQETFASDDGIGHLLTIDPAHPILAKLTSAPPTSSGSPGQDWVEVRPAINGTFDEVESGMRGYGATVLDDDPPDLCRPQNAAFGANGLPPKGYAPKNTIVLLYPTFWNPELDPGSGDCTPDREFVYFSGLTAGFTGVIPRSYCVKCVDEVLTKITKFDVYINGQLIAVESSPPGPDYGYPVDPVTGYPGGFGPWYDADGCPTETPPA